MTPSPLPQQPDRRLRHMVVLPLLTIVPVLLMTYFAIVHAQKAIGGLAPRAAEGTALRVSVDIETTIKNEISRVQEVARDSALINALRAGDSRRINERLAYFSALYPELPAWGVANRWGTMVGLYPLDEQRLGLNRSDRNWFKGVKASDWRDPYVSVVYLKLSPAARAKMGGGNADRPVWVVGLAAPVRHEGHPAGVIFANLSLVDLRRQMKPIIDRMQAGYAYVVDQKGRLVFHPDFVPDDRRYRVEDPEVNRNQVPPAMDYSDVPVVQEVLAGRNINAERIGARTPGDPGRRDESYLTWARPVPGVGWGVVVQQSQQEVMEPVREIAIRLVAGAATVVFLALIFAAGIAVTERQVLAMERQLAKTHYEYQLASERAHREADMAVGQEIQRRLLRKETLDGLEIECHTDPAQLVGGDFYSIFPLDATRQGIIVGDVSGKGVHAAMYMSVATTLLQTLGRREPSPALVLQAANDDMVPTMRRMNMYVTVFYGVLDTQRNVLTYANAGHPPPVLRRAGATEELEGYGVPIGITPDSEYEDGALQLTADDMLVLYSDGLIEARDDRNRMFGFDGLHALLARSAARTAAELMEELLAACSGVLQDREAEDDITLVVLRCPSPQAHSFAQASGEVGKWGSGEVLVGRSPDSPSSPLPRFPTSDDGSPPPGRA